MNETGIAADRPPRLRSLDALRGFDMLWIVGLAAIFRILSKSTDIAWLDTLAGQLEHVPWDGLRAYDLIFPLFMFLSGVSIPYALANKAAGSRFKTIQSILLRVAILILLGAMYNGLLQFNFETQRYASVLGQIGIAYGIAALVFVFTNDWKSRVGWLTLVLTVTTGLQLWVPVPDHGAGLLTQQGIINGWVDRNFLPGQLYEKIFDPEGLMCAFSSASLTLFGVLTGSFVRGRGNTLTNIPALWISGAGLILLGWVSWNLGYPPIKSAWTTTFCLLAGGISVCLFGLFHLVVDLIPSVNWSFPLQVVGMNPLTIYLLTRIVSFPAISAFFFNGVAMKSGEWSALVIAIGTLLIEWLLLWLMFRKKIFLRV